MSGSRLISAFGLAVIFSQISAILSADIVPVVLLGPKTATATESVDALRIMSKTEFSNVVWKIVGGSRPAIVVFTKDNLCIEEMSQEKLQFKNSHSHYFPSVEAPLEAFEELGSYNISKEDKPETISDGQLIFVTVQNLAVIPEIYTDLRTQSPKLIGVIAGASCSYSRSERTRRAVAARDESEIIRQADRILLYVRNGIYLKTAGEDAYTLLGEPSNATSVSEASDNVRFDLTFASTNASEVILRLQFTATASKYWYFNTIDYEANAVVQTLISNTSIHFPFNFSYHCTKDTIFSYNETTYLYFGGIQVQIDPSVSATTGIASFSDGWDCIGFTTIPIWSGIFVTGLLALILIWALTMIMDIRTMDRFDDPKGKTITVAVSE